jgi:hypothetical protein
MVEGMEIGLFYLCTVVCGLIVSSGVIRVIFSSAEGKWVLKEMFREAVAEIIAGIREAFQLYIAIIAAPFVVCIEFATNTGRWKRAQKDIPGESVGDRTAT